MLKLRKVDIVGFKSFCERTSVTFSGSGITCIVGPNGCGKSNVVDAISWVLGEQSHKSLRAERMADCIFNGTTKRPPLGLAEVTITLEDPELAEAARFVLEGEAQDGGAAGDGSDLLALGGDSAATDDVTVSESAEFSSHAGAEAGAETSAEIAPEEAGKSKRRKRGADKPALVTKPGEVVVSRRLYRSGQSEYLINGRVARLRDIQEMFMGVGLGPDSYAIIEQGRIGLILSTKPMERRAIIEEAAGVTKFKTKKRLAEAKLESSKVNLSRVNDIVVEVEKQLGSLKRQASKARRYAEVRDQMRGIVRQMLASKARELDTEAERLAAQHDELLRSETERAAALQQQEQEQDRLNQRIYELDAEMRQSQNHLGLTALELDRAENRLAFNRQRNEELAGRGQQIAQEAEQAAAQSAAVRARSQEQEETVAALRTEAAGQSARVEEFSRSAQTLGDDTQQAEQRIEMLRRSAAAAGEELTRLHGEERQAEEALLHQGEALRRLEASETELLESSIRLRDEGGLAAGERDSAAGNLRLIEQQAAELQARIAGLRSQRSSTETAAAALRDSLAAVRARRQTLEQILNDHSYTADAVKKLFAMPQGGDAAGRDFHAVGVLADYAEVEQQYEIAVEQFLREELQYVVVKTYEHARAGIALLREEVGGRATFFVDSLRNLELVDSVPVRPFRAEDGVIGRLDKLVEFRDPLGPAAKQFLPRLHTAFLTDSAAVAEKLAREYPQYSFVLPDGTCYQGRMVSGGRPDAAGPLGMKRELRALETEIAECERKSAEAQAAIEALAAELRGAEASLEELAGKQREAERSVFAATHRYQQVQSDLARLSLELTVCQEDLTRIRRDVEAAKLRAARAREEHAAASASRAAAEAESTRLVEELAGMRLSIQASQEQLAAARAEQAALAERLMAAESLAARLDDERLENERREAALRQQLAAMDEEAAALVRQSEEVGQQLEGLRGEKLRLEARQKELEQEWEGARTRVTQTEDHLRMGRQSLQELREARSHAEVDRARNDSDRQHLRETCLAEVNAHPEDLIAQEVAFLSGEELAAAESSYREMKARIEAMGPVNMMALEEYNECEQRFAFLTRERDDLLQSIVDTQQAIRELDEACREKFETAFNEINRSFSDAFHTIFGGGMAEMRLTEPDSSGDAGIDIVASPPGKRLQNILLLSGGEKAMTALALLIAIFRYQPSPFCILDEVDAPLDEANVGRFTRLVDQMSSQTQFIIVTHNRRTMEMGSVLYGVTMQEPGVSKLVSVRWEGEEAEAHAPKKAAAASAA
ncbi:MAG: chromosome segregation protein SMC [Acidobacteriia bacterium]|nr:chromosome segregation protein SMC [Terriglobia bacterium]